MLSRFLFPLNFQKNVVSDFSSARDGQIINGYHFPGEAERFSWPFQCRERGEQKMRSALIAVALAASAAVARAQTGPAASAGNLPPWLHLGIEERLRVEGFSGGTLQPDREDAYALQRLRLNLRLDPTTWMRFVFQGQDARVFGNSQVPDAPPYADTMDLRLGYVELGNRENKPFGLRVGRQELAFGEQRLIGHLNWTNTARSFDAVRATVRYGGYRLDAFAAAVVNLRNGEFDQRAPGNNLHGLYGAFEKLVPQATVEPYLLWRVAPGNVNFKVGGVRWAGKLPAQFDYSFEAATERGDAGRERMRAWAGHWLLGYSVMKARYAPRLIAEYNYASGDKDPNDGRRGTFDQLYPTGHDKYGLTDQVGWRNIQHLRGGLELKPSKKLLLTGSYHNWWLAQARDGLYNAAGALVVRSADGRAGRHVGQELDVQASYPMSKAIQTSVGLAHLFPGGFLKSTTPGRAYTYPYVMVGYTY
jgi:hypothetical protein